MSKWKEEFIVQHGTTRRVKKLTKQLKELERKENEAIKKRMRRIGRNIR